MPLESKTVQNFAGVFSTFQKLAQPKGAISRDSNLWFATRGALKTIPGSKIISTPGGGAPAVAWRAIQTFFPSIARAYKLFALSVAGSSASLFDVTGATWNSPPNLTIPQGTGMLTKRPAVLGGTPQPTPGLLPYADKLIVTTSDSIPPYMLDNSPAPGVPTLASKASGTLPATTYFVRITWGGYATPSAEVSLAVAANHVLQVTSPPAPPFPLVVNTYDVYVGTVSGQETWQATIPVGQQWTEPNSGLISVGGPTSPLGDNPGGHALLNSFDSSAKYGKWKPNHNFKQGHIIAILVDNIQFEYQATQSGKSGTGDGSKGNPNGADNANQFPTQVNATIVDGDTGWKCLGPLPEPPPGAAYAFSHLGFLWLWGTSSSYLADGINGPDAIWQSGLNNAESWDPAFTGFVGKGSGETAQGGAVLTLEESGIAATQQLVLFKDASTYSIFGDYSTSVEILQAPGGVGCIAPKSVQFMADLGVMRLASPGFTLFDGQNDLTDIYTDPIRSYIFGENDPTTNVVLIAPLDFNNIQLAQSTQVKEPRCYVAIAPVAIVAPPPAEVGFVSSGEVIPPLPPAPTVVSTVPFLFNSTGNKGPFGSPVLPIDIAVPIPAGVQPGDVLVALVMVEGWSPGVGASVNPIDPVPGWLVDATDVAHTVTFNLLHRVVDGTEGPTVTFQYSGPVFNYAGFTLEGWVAGIRGANTSAPVNVFNLGNPQQNGDGTATAQGVVTTVQNTLVLISMTPAGNDTTITPGTPAGTVVQVNAQSPAGQAIPQSLGVWSQAFAGPGATGSYKSPSGWDATLAVLGTAVIAIAPAAGDFGELQGFPEPASGAIVPNPLIKGASTLLKSPLGCVFDANGTLWVADSEAGVVEEGAIFAFKQPGLENGNVPPDQVISGPTQTMLANPVDVAIDPTNANILVANPGSGQILFFPPNASGDANPIASIGGGASTLVTPISVATDAAGNVYVLDSTQNAVLVFLKGHTGGHAPDQVITGASTLILSPLQVRISPDGFIWVTVGKTGGNAAYLLRFNTTDNGNVAPGRQITGTSLQPQTGNGGPIGLTFDASSNIYVAVAPQATVVVYAANSTGSATPLRTITGFLQAGGIAGFEAVPVATGGSTRMFIYDTEAQIWAIGDLPFPITAASFQPTLNGTESLIGHETDGTIRRIMNPADLDFDGTPITGRVRFPEFGRSSQPLFVHRVNFRADGSGQITAVTANEKSTEGLDLTRTKVPPQILTGPVVIKDKVLSLSLDLFFVGQVLIEGVEYQIASKPPTRVGR